MCLDALDRNESCGGHFREEYQTPEGEALRDDDELLATSRPGSSAATAEPPVLHKEPLAFEYVHPAQTELQVMNLTLHVWRQKNAATTGPDGDVTRPANVNPDMSFLEMLDVVNEDLIAEGRGADRLRPRLPRRHLRHVRLHDQRRRARPAAAGPRSASSTCAISRTATRSTSSRGARGRSRSSRTWSSTAAPSTASSPAGGFISVRTGSAPDGNAIPVPKEDAERAMDAAACIGCGACVATCPNASAVALHRRQDRAPRPAAAGPAGARTSARSPWWPSSNQEVFGNCTNIGECEAVCPKGIPLEVIARMNRDYLAGFFAGAEQPEEEPAEA